ncbi:MAG TPA: FtsX-like permease family protein [Spirochaetia bacterium]|nr:FtsX-like permease family protein [Spirochaetia bacterium]
MLLQVAFRNFTRNGRRFLLLGLAICAGYFFVCSIQSLVSGLSRQINVRGARYYGGHVIITRGKEAADAATLASDDRRIMDAIERSGVHPSAISHRTHYGVDGVVFFNGESVPMRRVIGMDWKTEGGMISGLQVVAGNPGDMADPRGAMISEVTARRLGAKVGDQVTLQVNRDGGAVNTVNFWVKAIFREVSIFGYYTLYVDRAELDRALGFDPAYFVTVGVYVDDYRAADRVAARINRELGGRYTVEPVVTFMTEIRTLLRALSAVSYGILVLLAVVIAVGILNLYRVIIYERTREIGTMRAIGIQRPQVRNLILLEALLLAVCGVAGGILLTFLVLTGVSWIPVGGSAGLDIFLDRGHLSWVMNPDALAVDALLVVLVTLAGALGPARAARDIDPAVAMRTD